MEALSVGDRILLKWILKHKEGMHNELISLKIVVGFCKNVMNFAFHEW
jgi:hypothetical protein